ncbi:4840_t:CDS:2 [Entrophospora sp. SA101]|nr:4840_t:CDS:2 [Entrophospora sp. SA101]CAJ0836535.1 7169_t:CDS:2 [Entrophospora sp. SA101]CAJ0860524.1 903_t:CDS:2 [Entrophospora sp. SA101]
MASSNTNENIFENDNISASSENKFNMSSNANEEANEKPDNEEVETIKILLFAIDTGGIGDRKLTSQEILYKIAETTDEIRDGINQILFVTNGRFREKEIDAYYLLQSIIFDDKDAFKYTTIVRTNFPVFEDDAECENDYQDMIKENKKLSQLVKSCKEVIHVDNPPITGRMKQVAEEMREGSRKKLLNYLETCTKVYYPPKLDNLNGRIKDHITDVEGSKITYKEYLKNFFKEIPITPSDFVSCFCNIS